MKMTVEEYIDWYIYKYGKPPGEKLLQTYKRINGLLPQPEDTEEEEFDFLL